MATTLTCLIRRISAPGRIPGQLVVGRCGVGERAHRADQVVRNLLRRGRRRDCLIGITDRQLEHLKSAGLTPLSGGGQLIRHAGIGGDRNVAHRVDDIGIGVVTLPDDEIPLDAVARESAPKRQVIVSVTLSTPARLQVVGDRKGVDLVLTRRVRGTAPEHQHRERPTHAEADRRYQRS